MKKNENKKEEFVFDTAKKKELLITVIVLIFAIVVGIFGGKALYEAMYGPI